MWVQVGRMYCGVLRKETSRYSRVAPAFSKLAGKLCRNLCWFNRSRAIFAGTEAPIYLLTNLITKLFRAPFRVRVRRETSWQTRISTVSESCGRRAGYRYSISPAIASQDSTVLGRFFAEPSAWFSRLSALWSSLKVIIVLLTSSTLTPPRRLQTPLWVQDVPRRAPQLGDNPVRDLRVTVGV